MKRYNLSGIMKAAWSIFRKGVSSFSMALKMAWANARSRNAAAEAAGVTEETHTWYGWKELGYEVTHESRCLYQAILADPATKSGTRRTSYFGLSQVQPIGA